MKNLKGFLIIYLCLIIGSFVKILLKLPIPEVVYGMVIMFVLLMTKIVKIEDIESVASGLSSILAFLFLPLVVSLMSQYELLGKNIFPILIIVLVSTTLTMGVTSKVVELIQRRRK